LERELTTRSFKTAAPQEVADGRTDEAERSSITGEFSRVERNFALNKVGFTENRKFLKLGQDLEGAEPFFKSEPNEIRTFMGGYKKKLDTQANESSNAWGVSLDLSFPQVLTA